MLVGPTGGTYTSVTYWVHSLNGSPCKLDTSVKTVHFK